MSDRYRRPDRRKVLTRAGRVRTYQLMPQQLKMAEHWLDKQRAAWERRLDQQDSVLEDMKEQQR